MDIRKGDPLVLTESGAIVVATSLVTSGKVQIRGKKGTVCACSTDDLEAVPKFRFVVSSGRWGHKDTYNIRLTSTGWHVSHIAINGDCDPSGHRHLFENLEQDFIKYPPDLGDMMAEIWRQAMEQGPTHDEVQEQLEAVAAVIRQRNGGS